MIVGSWFKKPLILGFVVLAVFRFELFGGGAVDSLSALLPNAVGEERIDLLNDLAEEIGGEDLDQATEFATQALNLSKKSGYGHGIGEAHLNLGMIYYYLGQYDESKANFNDALRICKELDDQSMVGHSINGIGVIWDETGKSDSALTYYLRARKIFEAIDDKEGIAESLNNIAALQHTNKNFEEAIKIMLEVLALDRERGDRDGVALALSNLGFFHGTINEFEKSIEYHQQSLEIRLEDGKNSEIAKSYNNIANSYASFGDSLNAEKYYNLSLGLKRELGNPVELAVTLSNMGQFMVGWEKPEKALGYLKEAITIARNFGLSLVLENSTLNLAKSYKQLGEFESAFDYLDDYRTFKDSLDKLNNQTYQDELITKYETAKKQKENEALKAREARLASRIYLLIAILAVVLLIAILMFNRYRAKIKTNNALRALNTELEARNHEIAEKNHQIEEQRDLLASRNEEIRTINSGLEKIVEERTASLRQTNQELDTFLYQSTHALRRPMMRMLGLYNLLENEEDPEMIKMFADKMSTTIKGMDHMVQKLVEINEVNSRRVQKETFRLIKMVQSVFHELEASSLPDLTFTIDIAADQLMASDKFMFRAMVRNVVENSINFRKEKGAEIKVSYREEEGEGILEFWDNGIGIPKEALEHVWEMFFRATEKSKGDGLGLYLTSKIAAELGARKSIESEEGEFTRISLFLPLS